MEQFIDYVLNDYPDYNLSPNPLSLNSFWDLNIDDTLEFGTYIGLDYIIYFSVDDNKNVIYYTDEIYEMTDEDNCIKIKIENYMRNEVLI